MVGRKTGNRTDGGSEALEITDDCDRDGASDVGGENTTWIAGVCPGCGVNQSAKVGRTRG